MINLLRTLIAFVIVITTSISVWSGYAVLNKGPKYEEIRNVLEEIYSLQKSFVLDSTRLVSLLVEDASQRTSKGVSVDSGEQSYQELITSDNSSIMETNDEEDMPLSISIEGYATENFEENAQDDTQQSSSLQESPPDMEMESTPSGDNQSIDNDSNN